MATYVGVAEAAADRAVELVPPKGERPDVAPQLGSMFNHLTAARDTVAAMIGSSGNLCFDNSIEAASLVLSRKTNAAEACRETVRCALEVGGGAAYWRGNDIERLFRDVHGAMYHRCPQLSSTDSRDGWLLNSIPCQECAETAGFQPRFQT